MQEVEYREKTGHPIVEQAIILTTSTAISVAVLMWAGSYYDDGSEFLTWVVNGVTGALVYTGAYRLVRLGLDFVIRNKTIGVDEINARANEKDADARVEEVALKKMMVERGMIGTGRGFNPTGAALGSGEERFRFDREKQLAQIEMNRRMKRLASGEDEDDDIDTGYRSYSEVEDV